MAAQDLVGPSLISLTLPGAIDVRQGAIDINFSASASDDSSGVAHVYIVFDKPFYQNGQALRNLNFSSSDNFDDGIATSTARIGSATVPGIYNVDWIEVEDKAGNSTFYFGPDLASMGLATSISVSSNAQPDNTTPSLTSLSFPAVVDVRNSDANVPVTVGAQDAAMDIELAIVGIDHIINGRRYFVGSHILRDSDDSFSDGISSKTITFDTEMSAGTYEIGYVVIRDRAGHSIVYSDLDLPALGFQTSFTVQSNILPDMEAPSLISLTLPQQIDITNGNVTGYFSIGATDVGRGVASASIAIDRQLLNGNNYQAYVFYAEDSIDSFGDGISSVPVYFNHTTGAGTYRVVDVSITDREGNTTTYNAAQLASMGLPTSFQVTDQNFPVPSTASNDFNGDGRSDINWRNDNGAITNWLSGGVSFAPNDGNAYALVPEEWRVAGTGDFNGDGRTDLLWRNEDGGLTSWRSNGLSFARNYNNDYSRPPIDWRVAGTGDFNGDGRDDILWRNDNGGVTDWLSNGSNFTPNDANAFAAVPNEWHIVGVGDFNGDGRDDILWRNDDGGVTSWHSNGAGFTPNYVYDYSRPPTDWSVAGTGDFNGDGRDDILWRNNNGGVTDWLSNGSGFTANDANAYSLVPNAWQIADTGDFNGDGRDDILWRHEDGGVTSWRSNGVSFTPNYNNDYSRPPADWHIEPRQSPLLTPSLTSSRTTIG